MMKCTFTTAKTTSSMMFYFWLGCMCGGGMREVGDLPPIRSTRVNIENKEEEK
jgi:hypothetical protein